MQAFETLLVLLNSDKELFLLPCFCDNLRQITFRIGDANNGPMIQFLPFNDENYDFIIRNNAGFIRSFPVQKSSQEFAICNSINLKIRSQIENESYKISLADEFSVSALIGNLERLVEPIFR